MTEVKSDPINTNLLADVKKFRRRRNHRVTVQGTCSAEKGLMYVHWLRRNLRTRRNSGHLSFLVLRFHLIRLVILAESGFEN
jgi:hypothetical protein